MSAENVDFGKKKSLERHSRSYIINFEMKGTQVRKLHGLRLIFLAGG